MNSCKEVRISILHWSKSLLAYVVSRMMTKSVKVQGDLVSGILGCI